MAHKLLEDEYFYIGSFSIILLALVYLGEAGLPVWLQILRVILGLGIVLFVPGYCLQAAAFPSRSDLDGKERLALSFGLSLAVIPTLALILDYLPWKITIWSVMISWLIFILLFSILGMIRRARLPEEDRNLHLRNVNVVIAWRSMEGSYRIAYILLGIVLLVTGLTAVSIITSTKPAELMTEFYLLGPKGKAENYPREGVAGQPLSVTVGIHNLEGAPAGYRVEVRDGEGVIGESGTILLENGGTSESKISFTPRETGDDVEVIFLLFRDHLVDPYRTLRLFMAVKPSQ